jgi:hypothetical protein
MQNCQVCSNIVPALSAGTMFERYSTPKDYSTRQQATQCSGLTSIKGGS